MRNEGRLKLGYFPLPLTEARNIAKMLAFSETRVSALDPCAGEGDALLEVTAGASHIDLYGVEIESGRAKRCGEKGITTIHSDFGDVNGGGTVSLVYCNPPYDVDGSASTWKRRQEQRFLELCTDWLAPGGLLIFVVPSYVLSECAARFATHYEHVRVFRLSAPAALLYRQIVVFAVRKKVSTQLDYRVNATVRDAASDPQSLPILADAIASDELPYTVRKAVDVNMYSRAFPIDLIEDLLPETQSYKLAGQFLLPVGEVEASSPPTPLHAGHIGLLCSAGMLNGVFGEGERRHVAQWRTSKHIVHLPQTEQEKQEGVTRCTERFSTEVTLLFESGEYDFLSASPKKDVEPAAAEL